MLPTPEELREQSQAYREAARHAGGEAGRVLATYALVLAQVAEAVEREGASIAPAKADSYWHLLAQALSDDVRQLVKAFDTRSQVAAWRMRAEELRTTADQFQVPSAQDTLRRAAANYDQLADNAVGLLGRRPPVTDEKAG
jgi:hypothetical protein